MPTLSHPNFLVSAGIHLLTSEARFLSANYRISACAISLLALSLALQHSHGAVSLHTPLTLSISPLRSSQNGVPIKMIKSICAFVMRVHD